MRSCLIGAERARSTWIYAPLRELVKQSSRRNSIEWLVGGSRGFLYGNIIQDFFTKAANWPLGSALSMIMLLGTMFLVLLATRLIDVRQLFE